MELALKDNKDGIVIASIGGNLLGETDNQPLMEFVKNHIDEGQHNFIFNLEDMRYINSTGLGALLTVLTKSRNVGGELVMVKIPEQLSKLLVITKLSSIFTVMDDEDSAVKYLGN